MTGSTEKSVYSKPFAIRVSCGRAMVFASSSVPTNPTDVIGTGWKLKLFLISLVTLSAKLVPYRVRKRKDG